MFDGGLMKKDELRKEILRCNEQLKEIREFKVFTYIERENKQKEIKALEEKIKKMKEELYYDENDNKD